MTAKETIAARFQSDIRDHQMTVRHDDGLYRHIIFSRPGSSVFRFELVTIPGYLMYVGDMGAFTFQRLPDMLAFFRADSGRINPYYWSQKLEAIDRAGGFQEFDSDAFRRALCEQRVDWIREHRGELSREARADLWAEVDAVLDSCDREDDAHQAARDFDWDDGTLRFRFDLDHLHELDMKRYTHRFLWCCHALVWAIPQYDAWKAAQQPKTEATA